MWFWEYESCDDCGKCFKICWGVKDNLWKQVMNRDDELGGSLCVDCFIIRANKKRIELRQEDFTLEIFNPQI